MLLTIVIIANIPVYLFIGWVLFDTEDHGASFEPERSLGENLLHTAWGALRAIIEMVFLPRWAFGIDDDEDDTFGSLIMVVIFLASCVAIVWGEILLIDRMFGTG